MKTMKNGTLCATLFASLLLAGAAQAQAINIPSGDSKTKAAIAMTQATGDAYPQHWSSSVNTSCSPITIGPNAGTSSDPNSPLYQGNSMYTQTPQNSVIVTGTIYNICGAPGQAGQ